MKKTMNKVKNKMMTMMTKKHIIYCKNQYK